MSAARALNSAPHTYLPLLCLALLPLLILASCYQPSQGYLMVSRADAEFATKSDLQFLLTNSTSFDSAALPPKANPFRSIHTHAIDQGLIQLRLLKGREASKSLDYYLSKRKNSPQVNEHLVNWLSSFLPTKQTQGIMFSAAKYCGIAMFLVVIKEAFY
ncbi:hypothetical protein K7432_014461 [Basidiobolus ranarum]|uniref:Uncharacterized protein n=1 Tax=Basidiobolus ranarum TaxID=34480 RepID=A0ABR2VPM0_9FUNG